MKNPDTDRRPQNSMSMFRLISLIEIERSTMFLASLFLTIRSLILLIIPWPLKLIIDNVIGQKPVWKWLVAYVPDPTANRMELLTVLAVSMLILGAAETFLSYQGERLLLINGQMAVFKLRSRLFAHLQGLSLAFHRRRKVGELMARLGGDIQTLQDFVVGVGAGIFLHLTTATGIVAILFIVDWRYAITILLVVLPLLWLAQIYNRKIKRVLRRARQKEGEVWGIAQETLIAIQIVQAYGREGAEEARFRTHADESMDLALAANSLQLRLPRLVSFVLTGAATFTVWVGAIEVVRGGISVGELLVGLAYLRGLATPVRQLAKLVAAVGKAEVAADRITELLSEVTDVKEMAGARAPASCRGELEFRNVAFSYENGKRVLSDISFRVVKGQTVALVGASGAGKSTIANLLLRFHDPVHGEIWLDGTDIRSLPLAYLRSNIAFISQEPILLSGPVWENIAIGRKGANREDAIRAAQETGISDIIERLPDGFDTIVGERGTTLSGGQRQVVSFARAMLRDSPIVILDEPTSSLDAVTERRILQALERLVVGRTVIVIAHRLQTIVGSDQIVVLNAGCVSDMGTHDELLRRGGHYAKLWRHQRTLTARADVSY